MNDVIQHIVDFVVFQFNSIHNFYCFTQFFLIILCILYNESLLVYAIYNKTRMSMLMRVGYLIILLQ